MNHDDLNQHAEYARNKMIEEYNKSGKDEEMKTGKAITEEWIKKIKEPSFHPGYAALLITMIDAALQEARAEGEIVGWENANKMVKVMLGKSVA